MILFQGFLDLTDELFTHVQLSVQKKRSVEKEKTKKILNVSHTSTCALPVYPPKGVYLFF